MSGGVEGGRRSDEPSSSGPDGLYAVVVNYCQYEETLGCVDSLTGAGLPGDRIVVVDNASPDGSGDDLAEALDECRFLQSRVNGGYGAGNNLAIERILARDGFRMEHVFICNPDVRVQERALERAVEALQRDPAVGGVSSVQWRTSERQRLDPYFESWLSAQGLDPGALQGTSFVSTETLLGAAMTLSREALLEVGAFDPLYFLYAEEEDLARRLRYHGFEVGVAAGSHVVHSRPYLQGGDGRVFQRRSSKYLFHIKDPFSPVSKNTFRVAKSAAGNFLRCLSRDEGTLRDWFAEVGWFLRRLPAALTNRSRERRGRAHLDIATVRSEQPART